VPVQRSVAALNSTLGYFLDLATAVSFIVEFQRTARTAVSGKGTTQDALSLLGWSRARCQIRLFDCRYDLVLTIEFYRPTCRMGQ
jgi:hypothetical protein